MLLLTALLASCGETAAALTETGTGSPAQTAESAEKTAEPAETETVYSSALAPEDFGGREIRILTYANSD